MNKLERQLKREVRALHVQAANLLLALGTHIVIPKPQRGKQSAAQRRLGLGAFIKRLKDRCTHGRSTSTVIELPSESGTTCVCSLCGHITYNVAHGLLRYCEKCGWRTFRDGSSGRSMVLLGVACEDECAAHAHNNTQKPQSEETGAGQLEPLFR